MLLRSAQLVILLFISGTLMAVTKTASTGDWNTAGTWSPSGVPGGSDNVIIPAGVTVTLSADFAVFLLPLATVNTITINGTLNLNNAGIFMRTIDILTVNAGGQITASGIGAFIGSGLTFFTTGNTSFPISGPQTINGGTLPINLLFFEGQPLQNGIVLRWASATELNFDYYRIEYSLDGQKFESLSEITGSADSEQRKDYEYIDYAPSIGKNYYRLVSVDLDGYTEKFTTILIYYDPEKIAVKIYPNPIFVGEEFSIQPNFKLLPGSKIEVCDIQGKSIINQLADNNTTIKLSTSGLTSGMYLIRLTTNKGLFTEKLIIK